MLLVGAKICTAVLLFALLFACGSSNPEVARALQESTVPETTHPVPPTERPNVVVIMADDLEVGPLQRFPGAFPNITALAESGVSFENAFATDPLCCPSRATFLSGKYSHNNNVWDNQGERGGWDAFKPSEPDALPTWLDGYETALYGRYLNKYDGSETPSGWDEWGGVPLMNNVSPARMEGYDAEGFDANGKTHTQVLADEAAGFVGRSEGPFFLHVTPYAPHAPEAHPPEYDSLFEDARVPRTPSFDERDVSDKPPWISRLDRLSGAEQAAMDAEYRDRLRSLKDVDDMVGTVTEALRDSGKLENTHVVFTSDHGFHLGQRRLKPGKWMGYGHDVRVPLIVAGPGVPEGAERNALVGNHDLAPTIAGWAGAEPSVSVDGRSLAPLLKPDTPGTPWRDFLPTEAAANPWTNRPAFRGLISQKYFYIRYGGGEKELYDRRRDPYQLRSRPEHPAARALDRRLDELVDCSGRSCRVAEDGAETIAP